MSALKHLRAWCLGLFACGACGERPAEVRVHVLAVDELGAPIAGSEVSLDGVATGATAADGSLWLSWDSEQRGRVELALRCPEGYRAPPPRRLRAQHEGVRRLTLVCAPTTRSLLVAIDARGAEGLPVRVDGEQVGEVADTGLFHAQIERMVGSEPRVSIDTRSRPELRPQNPLASVRLDRDEMLVLKPEFRTLRKRRGHRNAGPKEVVPQRLRSL